MISVVHFHGERKCSLNVVIVFVVIFVEARHVIDLADTCSVVIVTMIRTIRRNAYCIYSVWNIFYHRRIL